MKDVPLPSSSKPRGVVWKLGGGLSEGGALRSGRTANTVAGLPLGGAASDGNLVIAVGQRNRF